MSEVIIITTLMGIAMTGVISVAVVLPLVLWVLAVVGRWKMFDKAGIAGWKSLIPFYNIYLVYKIAGLNGWYCLPVLLGSFTSGLQLNSEQMSDTTIMMIGVAGIILGIAALVCEIKKVSGLAKNFSKGTGFAVGLFFLESIFEMILGFGKAEYVGKKVE